MDRLTQIFGMDSYYVPQGSTYGARQMAALYRREWEDHKARYLPRMRELIDFATDENAPEEAAKRSGELVDRAYTSLRGDTERSLSRFGVTENKEERENRLRLTHNSRMAAKADAKNMSRIHTKDVQNQVLSGNLAAGLKENRIGEYS